MFLTNQSVESLEKSETHHYSTYENNSDGAPIAFDEILSDHMKAGSSRNVPELAKLT